MAKNPPITRFPDSVAVTYYRDVRALIDEMGKLTLKTFDEYIKPEISNYQNRVDSAVFVEDGPLDIIRQAIDTMRALSTNIFSADNVLNAATKFVSGVERFNRANIQQQARLKGFDPTEFEPWLDEFMRTAVSENVGWIKTIRDDFFPQIESIIYQGVKNGDSPREMRQQLMRRVGMSRNRAKFIARDQAGSVLGQLTKQRHNNMGVKKFKWVTSNDERVRATHKVLNGKIFEYSNPPTVGIPGRDYNCRCTATPVFEDE